MVPKLRIQYPGVVYDAMNRGDQRGQGTTRKLRRSAMFIATSRRGGQPSSVGAA
jgi:hypothetical protein